MKLVFTDNMFIPFQELHSAYSQFLGPQSHERVLNYQESEEDEQRCVQALIHYSTWTRQKLVEAVPLRRRIQYYTIDQTEATLAKMGVGKSECKGPIAASTKWLNEKQAARAANSK